MRTFLSLIFTAVFFIGCSTKSPPNNWQYKSASAFGNYTKYFLSNKEILAKSSLKSAIEHAKQSADLNQLAHIYLGVCALNISVGNTSSCNKFKQLQELVVSKSLDNYSLMLEKKFDTLNSSYLPKEYQRFVGFYLLKDDKKIFQSIESMQRVSSKFIAASLVKNRFNKTQVEYLIQQASFYGYKKVVIYWLEHLLELENNIDEKNKIRKKLSILVNR